MRELRAVLLAEGSSDRGLIDVLVKVFERRGNVVLEVDWGNERLALFRLRGGLGPRIEKLIELESDYDLLFVHRDADGSDSGHRFEEIRQAFASQRVQRPYVCIVPVQELEAWLLADEPAILTQFGRKTGSLSLGLPKPRQIEQRARPKEVLMSALALAKAGRHDTAKAMTVREFGRLRARLLAELDIDGPVNQLAAWQRLLADIDEAISTLARDHAQEKSQPCPPSTSS